MYLCGSFIGKFLFYSSDAYYAYQEDDLYDTFCDIGCIFVVGLGAYKILTPTVSHLILGGEIIDPHDIILPDMWG